MKYLILIATVFTLSACATMETSNTETSLAISDSLANQADLAYIRSDWQKSEGLYLQLVEENPGNGLYWYRLGNIYSATNRLDAAIVAYQQSLITDPANSDAWFNLGMTQLKQSAYTFNSMQPESAPDNQVTIKAEKILNGILQLLEQQ